MSILNRFQRLLHALIDRRLTIIFTAAYTILSLYVILFFLRASNLGDMYFKTTFESMMSGNAWKPFVYRVLMPKLVEAILAITPNSLENAINIALFNLSQTDWAQAIGETIPWIKRAFPHANGFYVRGVMTLLIYGALWGYIWVLHRLAGVLFPGRRAMQLFSPIFGLLAIASFSWPAMYVYDIPQMFLSGMCFYCIATARFNRYLIFFTLACLNKETTVFMFLFFTLWCWQRIPNSQFVTLWAAQFFIYVMLKVAFTDIYLNNPGMVLEHNTSLIFRWDVFAASNLHRILVIAAIWFSLTFCWQKKPLFAKYVFWIAGAIYICYLCFGYVAEYRVFFDIFPLLTMLLTHTLIDATGIGNSPVFLPVKEESCRPGYAY